MSDYRDKTMNIQPPKPSEKGNSPGVEYKLGHRDARHAAAEIACEADAELTSLRDKLAEAEAIIGKLPKTADGVTVVPGMVVYDEEGHSFRASAWLSTNGYWTSGKYEDESDSIRAESFFADQSAALASQKASKP
jgi:hypothetical protein